MRSWNTKVGVVRSASGRLARMRYFLSTMNTAAQYVASCVILAILDLLVGLRITEKHNDWLITSVSHRPWLLWEGR